jgi:hypothetical protein
MIDFDTNEVVEEAYSLSRLFSGQQLIAWAKLTGIQTVEQIADCDIDGIIVTPKIYIIYNEIRMRRTERNQQLMFEVFRDIYTKAVNMKPDVEYTEFLTKLHGIAKPPMVYFYNKKITEKEWNDERVQDFRNFGNDKLIYQLEISDEKIVIKAYDQRHYGWNDTVFFWK